MQTIMRAVSLRLCAAATVVVVASYLSGCSLATSIKPDQPMSLAEDEALILASTTMQYEGSFFARVSFLFTRAGSRGNVRLDSAVPWTIWPMLEDTPEPGLEEQHGRLYALRVPAGEYSLKQIAIHDVPLIAVAPKERLTFSVSAGEIIYIGNLDVRLCHLLSPEARYPYYVVGGRPSVRDASDRDLPLLRARFPQLNGANVEIRLLDNQAMQDRYGDLARRCPIDSM